jgi:2-amino-4-hydroxy-6-hydroxymethyldihydropteridine diphosphokinase
MPRAGIALGSNLGQRLANLQAALARLCPIAKPGEPILQAPVYQTTPVCCPAGSPDFYNTVVEIDYDGTPAELFQHTQTIESTLGRVHTTVRNAPRSIDVDLLYCGDAILSTAWLVLPHPRLTQRRFVLQPLADIRPDLILPGDHASIAWHLSQLAADSPPLALVQTAW